MHRWVRLAFLLLGGAVLVLLVANTDLAGLVRAVRGARLHLILLAFFLLIGNVTLKAVRWQVMAAQLNPRRLPLPAAAAAILAGVSAASLIPGRGIELAKPLLLRNSRGVPLSASAGAVVVERLLDAAALVALFGAALIFLPVARGSQFRPVLIAVGVFLVLAVALMAVPARLSVVVTRIVDRLPLSSGLRARLSRAAAAFLDSLAAWRRHPRLWLVVTLSVLAAVVEAGRVAIVFAALGVPLALTEAMLTFSAANLIAVASLIPGGIGITEFSMAGITRFVTAGRFAPAAVTAAVLVDRMFSYYLIVFAGALVLLATGTWQRGSR